MHREMNVAPAVVTKIMAIRAALRVALPVDCVPAHEKGGRGGRGGGHLRESARGSQERDSRDDSDGDACSQILHAGRFNEYYLNKQYQFIKLVRGMLLRFLSSRIANLKVDFLDQKTLIGQYPLNAKF